MKIGIVGGGTVGRAICSAFVEHESQIRIYDTVSERRTHTIHDVLMCDLVFVCLPTPWSETGNGLDTSYVWDFFNSIQNDEDSRSIKFVLKSTVPIGTTRNLVNDTGLSIVHSPEFLTARCASMNMHTPTRNIIGEVHNTPSLVDLEGCRSCADLLIELYESRYKGVQIQSMTSCESEAVKLMQNAFFATKISFMNEAREVLEGMGS